MDKLKKIFEDFVKSLQGLKKNLPGKDPKDVHQPAKESKLDDLKNVECKKTKAPDLKNLKAPDLKNLKLPDVNKLNLDLKNVKLPDMKNMKIPDLKNLKIPDLKNLKIPDLKNLKIPDLKNLNWKDMVRKYLGTRSPKRSVFFVGDRPMKYPYTFTAKIMQFPFLFYYDNNWMFKYYGYAIIASLPFFWYFNSLANSPNNVAVWKEIRRKEREEAHRRFSDDFDEEHH